MNSLLFIVTVAHGSLGQCWSCARCLWVCGRPGARGAAIYALGAAQPADSQRRSQFQLTATCGQSWLRASAQQK